MKSIIVTLFIIFVLTATAFYLRPGLHTDEEGTAKVLELKAFYERMAIEQPAK